jgi:hypothetical protein
VIDDQYLSTLADPRSGPATSRPPVASVLARGTRLRRRRYAVRTAGVGTIVIGAVGAGFLAVGRQTSTQPDAVAAGGRTTTSDVPSSPPPPLPECMEDPSRMEMVGPTPVDAAEVPDGMRVLPSFQPDSEPISYAKANRWVSDCEDVPEPGDAALKLRATDAAGVSTGGVELSGPLARTTADQIALSEGDAFWGSGVTSEEVPFRSGTATFVDYSAQDAGLMFEWHEPDGWGWSLRSEGVDRATLQAVGEALVLDSSPEGDEPVAVLPDASVPVGFAITWQALGAPVPAPADNIQWEVVVGESEAVSHGIECQVEVKHRWGAAPISSYGGVGSSPTSVNGHDAMWTTAAGNTMLTQGNALTWEISPGFTAQAGCVNWGDHGIESVSRDVIVQFAESFEPVAADDPRIP